MGVIVLPKRDLWQPPLGSQINWGHPIADKLTACWPFNQGGGLGEVFDIARFHHASINGSLSWSPMQKGIAGNFDGASAYTSVSSFPKINANVNSVSFWYYTRTKANYETCFINGIDPSTNKNHWIVGLLVVGWDAIFRTRTSDIDYHNYYLTGTSANNKLYHIVVIWDGTTKLGYVNGVYNLTHDASAGAETDFANLNDNQVFDIGGGLSGLTRYYLDGFILNFLVWHRKISSDEVIQLYEEPFCFMQPKVNRFYSLGAGGGIEDKSANMANKLIAGQLI